MSIVGPPGLLAYLMVAECDAHTQRAARAARAAATHAVASRARAQAQAETARDTQQTLVQRARRPWSFALAASVLCMLLALQVTMHAVGVHAKEAYEAGESVPVYVNVVGPYSNPSERYPFYSLPYCPVSETEHKHLSLGEVLDANKDVLVSSLFAVKFKESVTSAPLCVMKLDAQEMDEFRFAIHHDYYFNMMVDDMPVWGFVGAEDPHTMLSTTTGQILYNHFTLRLKVNGQSVVGVDLVSTGVAIPDEGGAEVPFTYSVEWVESEIAYADRMQAYFERDFFEENASMQWLSVLNSAVLAVLLAVFVAGIVLRAVRSDLARYNRTLDDEDTEEDETGWKQVKGDVFRAPSSPLLLSAVIGTGSQLLAIVFLSMLSSSVGLIYPYSRGGVYSVLVGIFVLTTVVNGFFTVWALKMTTGAGTPALADTKWVYAVLLSLVLTVGPMFGVWSVLNSVAVAYGSVQALPASTVFLLVFIFVAVAFPLLVAGAALGRRAIEPLHPPCRVRIAPREIPPQSSLRVHGQAIITGLLPFSAAYVEIHYLFVSVWGHTVQTLYGLLLVSFGLLLVVTACITVAFTYFQLNAEDYRWWWQSFMNGGAPAIFLIAYAFYYFAFVSDMYGVMQTLFFYGYMALASYYFFILMGTCGFFASFRFVNTMYRSIKSD